MKNVLIMCVAASVAVLSLRPVLGQDAAAPFRRTTPSPTPEAEAPTPEPAEQAATSPPVQTPTPKPAPAPVEPASTPVEKVKPAVATKPREETARRPSVGAAERRRSVLNEKPVRAVEPHKPFIQRMPAQSRKGPRASRPTFDISESSWATAATIRSFENKWQTAIKNHDVEALDQLLADNLEATSATGKEGSKETLLRLLKKDTNVYKSVRAREMSVQNVGPDTATVTGITTETGTTKEGKPFKSSRRFTDTWKQKKRVWQCVSSKATALPEKATSAR